MEPITIVRVWKTLLQFVYVSDVRAIFYAAMYKGPLSLYQSCMRIGIHTDVKSPCPPSDPARYRSLLRHRRRAGCR